MTSIELLKEIESWLSFNTEPSKEETAKLRKSIKEHLAEQLCIHDVMCEFHCERFYFGRDKKCEQQCSDCHWMQTKSQ